MAAQRSDLAVPTHADPDEQDQRGHPRILPACQRCAHSDTAVALRTDYVLYTAAHPAHGYGRFRNRGPSPARVF